jgi:hypothetical protein
MEHVQWQSRQRSNLFRTNWASHARKEDADISTLCECPMKTLEIAKSATPNKILFATDLSP